ncbi:unnamed protein product [Arabidopsis thaliana]|uniref:(thale cress) hypothetical protein n=1 Tax=Arabidopsis thaliana TaxID=3702 RepID=A0A7G2EZ01_ARATH|nr:unnamed protein product [Arabidopsis thaliana]
MRMSKKISLSIFLIVLISINAVAFSPLCIDEIGFEPNIVYKNNTRDILSDLVTNVTAPRYFYNASLGQDNTVYAMGMCITKSEPTACSDCISAAADELKSCPNKAEAYTWRSAHNALCFARYSNRSFSNTSALDNEIHPLYEYNSEAIKTNLTLESFEYNKWNPFIGRLVTNASTENGTLLRNRKYYATGELFLTNYQSVYALMQCIPDLVSELCKSCLLASEQEYKTSACRGTQSGIIAQPRCFFRWDMQPFSGAFDPDRKDQNKRSKKISTTIFIAAVVLAALLSFVLSAVVVVLVFRRRNSNSPPDSLNRIPRYSLQYDLKTIQAATCTFSRSNMLGQGGFGDVFKGLLQDGSEIAVKRLSKESAQGVQEFQNETSLVAKLQHRNLVGVLGFCMEGEEKILVYEFVPNKSLDQFLFELEKNYQSNEVFRCIHIALLCVQNDPEQRPNLSTIIMMLTSNSITLPVPQSPVYEGMDMFLPSIKSLPGSVNDSLIDDLVPR